MRFSVLVVAVGLVVGTPVSVQAPSAQANRSAYNIALTCNAVAAYFDDQASYALTADAVTKMGRVLGYDSRRTSSDMIDMASALGVRQRNDPDSMRKSRDGCRRIGFAS